MTWYLKGNSRRFFRIDMPTRLFIVPVRGYSMSDIYTTGIQYANEAVLANVYKYKGLAMDSYHKLKVQDPFILEIIEQFFSVVDELYYSLERLSDGIAEAGTMEFINKKSWLRGGISYGAPFVESSPKTLVYFQQIEEKLQHYLENVVHSIEKSNLDMFAYTDYKTGFKIDGVIESLSSKADSIPLIGVIVNVYRALDVVFTSFYRMNEDNKVKGEPSFWEVHDANISACGIAIKNLKKFNDKDRVDVQIYLPDLNRTATFDGKVLSSMYDSRTMQNVTIVDFNFPTGDNQQNLLTQIQIFEACSAIKELPDAWSCT